MAGFSFGNGRSIAKDYDGNYAIDALTSSATDGLNLDFEVDVLGNIIAITPTGVNNPEQERHYDYDRVYRLTEVRDANQALIEAFTYDRTGNRLSQQVGSDPAQPYGYPANSHRLTSVDGVARSFDAAGNLTAILSGSAHPEFQVGTNNRLQAYRFDGQQLAGYVYNGQGERACKWLGSDPIRYVYDTGGRLLGEYDASGNALAEYVYLDTLPVAVFAAGSLAYIETDHLGTPRVVVDAASNLALWRWPLTGSAFGEHAPDEDPHSTGTPYAFNLRFPGQYFDAESGLHYNYFRDYEPGTGRYIQSDPIGLEGGINTYGYVAADPIRKVDPEGLDYWVESAHKSEAGMGFHQSICVGEYSGERFCISFGRKPGQGNCWFECDGHVYVDRSPRAPIDYPLFRKTSRATDRQIRRRLEGRLREPGRPWNVLGGENCRVFSQDMFWQLNKEFGGESWPGILMRGNL